VSRVLPAISHRRKFDNFVRGQQRVFPAVCGASNTNLAWRAVALWPEHCTLAHLRRRLAAADCTRLALCCGTEASTGHFLACASINVLQSCW